MIHDSYGVHACNVYLMHKVLREEFVNIYSKPVLEKFRRTVIKEVREEVEKLPEGELVIEEVKQSPYFFS